MSEDRLLRELGHLAREEEGAEKARLDERWDRLAAGMLSTEEDAELRALAETSPEAREVYEAFRPLGADFQARVVAAISAEIDRRKKKERFHFFDFLLALPPLARWLTAAGTVTAGLLLRFAVFPPMAPLVAVYAVLPIEGIKISRGEEPPTGPPLFVPGSMLTMVVQPQEAVDGKVEAHAFLARGAEILPWEPEPLLEITDSGSVRLQGMVGSEIQLPPGMWRIWVVVGRPEKLPSLSELQDAVRAGRTRRNEWQAVSADLRVLERPPP